MLVLGFLLYNQIKTNNKADAGLFVYVCHEQLVSVHAGLPHVCSVMNAASHVKATSRVWHLKKHCLNNIKCMHRKTNQLLILCNQMSKTFPTYRTCHNALDFWRCTTLTYRADNYRQFFYLGKDRIFWEQYNYSRRILLHLNCWIPKQFQLLEVNWLSSTPLISISHFQKIRIATYSLY